MNINIYITELFVDFFYFLYPVLAFFPLLHMPVGYFSIPLPIRTASLDTTKNQNAFEAGFAIMRHNFIWTFPTD